VSRASSRAVLRSRRGELRGPHLPALHAGCLAATRTSAGGNRLGFSFVKGVRLGQRHGTRLGRKWSTRLRVQVGRRFMGSGDP
jgi:hypothetical protein